MRVRVARSRSSCSRAWRPVPKSLTHDRAEFACLAGNGIGHTGRRHRYPLSSVVSVRFDLGAECGSPWLVRWGPHAGRATQECAAVPRAGTQRSLRRQLDDAAKPAIYAARRRHRGAAPCGAGREPIRSVAPPAALTMPRRCRGDRCGRAKIDSTSARAGRRFGCRVPRAPVTRENTAPLGIAVDTAAEPNCEDTAPWLGFENWA